MNFQNENADSHIREFQRGEKQAFFYFFAKLHPPALYFAFRLLHDGKAAEEILEEAFKNLWKIRDQFTSEQAIKSWLYNHVRDACLPQMHRFAFNNRPDKLSWPGHLVDNTILGEVTAELHVLFEGIQRDYFKVLELHYLQGKDIAAIAAELDITIDSVRVRRARALYMLLDKFKKS